MCPHIPMRSHFELECKEKHCERWILIQLSIVDRVLVHVRKKCIIWALSLHLTAHLNHHTHVFTSVSLHCLGDLRCCMLILIIIPFAGGLSRPLVYLCKVNVFAAAPLWFPWWFIEGKDQKNLQGECWFFRLCECFIADCRGHRGSKRNNGQNALWIWGCVRICLGKHDWIMDTLRWDAVLHRDCVHLNIFPDSSSI